jgi:hypothetical protein
LFLRRGSERERNGEKWEREWAGWREGSEERREGWMDEREK